MTIRHPYRQPRTTFLLDNSGSDFSLRPARIEGFEKQHSFNRPRLDQSRLFRLFDTNMHWR
jgi:hypothetical protein